MTRAQSREYTIARKAFAAQRFGVTPDLMAMALTNGTVPVGAVAVRDTIYETVTGAALAGAIELYQGYTHPGKRFNRERTEMTDVEQDLSAGVGFIEGEFYPISEVRISISDLGFLMSDCTHDAAHVWKGSFFRLDDHIDRFERSLARLNMTLPYSRADTVDIVIECVRRSGLRDSLVYLIATRGIPSDRRRDLRTCTNRFIAVAYPFLWYVLPEQMETGAHVVISSIVRIPPESVDPIIKNFNRLDFSRALFEAYDRGSEHPLLTDFEGNITEGRGFNVFALFGGKLVSPERGVLEGMTRQTVMELCAQTNVKAEFGKIKADDLRKAEEVFLTSTAGGVMPVTKVDDEPIGNGSPGPLTLRLKDLYWALHDNPKYATPIAYD